MTEERELVWHKILETDELPYTAVLETERPSERLIEYLQTLQTHGSTLMRGRRVSEIDAQRAGGS